MFAAGKSASSAMRSILSFLAIFVFALWVTEAHAAAGGGTGGSSGGGSNGGGGPSGGPGNGPGDGDRGDVSRDRGSDTVTRGDTKPGTVPQGFVISDDICTGGKWDKC